MKNIISLAVVLAAAVQLSFGQGIHFEKGDFESALKKAKEENKMLFVDAYTVWCGPCKWMTQNTFLDKEVGEYFDEHLIAIKVDVERGNGPEIQKKYAIKGLPGYVFLDADGVVLLRASGSKPVDEFMKVVKQAKAYENDPNSIGRLAERYQVEKDNEDFLLLYLDCLQKANTQGYADVMEDYLKVQTSMKPSSGEMALFLAKHANAIIYGGEAERIIKNNFLTDEWRQVVRKDVRQVYQYLPEQMERQTFNYAVQTKEMSWIELLIQRSAEKGKALSKEQREKLLINYYFRTANGAAYKEMQLPIIELFYNSLDTAMLKENYRSTLQSKKESPGRLIISKAERQMQQLMKLATDFSQFVETKSEKEEMLKWAYTVYDVMSDVTVSIDFYANVLYLYGDKELAFELKEKALQMSAGDKKEAVISNQLSDMKSGKSIKLL